jgi:hypothetical protein
MLEAAKHEINNTKPMMKANFPTDLKGVETSFVCSPQWGQSVTSPNALGGNSKESPHFWHGQLR